MDTMNTETLIQPPRGKQKKLYARSQTLREAAERLLETADERAELSPRFDENELWRPS